MSAKRKGSSERAVGRPRGTGSQVVYARLREKILRLQIPPGSALDEFALVEEFKVSRTPIREALIRLASDELILLYPNQAPRVAPMDIIGTKEQFESLELAQRATTRWAALRRADDSFDEMRRTAKAFADAAGEHDYYRMVESNLEFHMAIANACGNRHVAKFYYSQLSSTLRIATITLANATLITGHHRAYFDHIIAEHDQMIDAIERRDAQAADKLAQDHSRAFQARIVRFIRANLADQLQFDDTPVDTSE